MKIFIYWDRMRINLCEANIWETELCFHIFSNLKFDFFVKPLFQGLEVHPKRILWINVHIKKHIRAPQEAPSLAVWPVLVSWVDCSRSLAALKIKATRWCGVRPSPACGSIGFSSSSTITISEFFGVISSVLLLEAPSWLATPKPLSWFMTRKIFSFCTDPLDTELRSDKLARVDTSDASGSSSKSSWLPRWT